jgi:glucan phosphorylase
MSLIEEGYHEPRCAWPIWHRRQLLGQRRRRSCIRELLKRACSAISTSCGRNKFNNKTNGVTPRRWLARLQPRPGALISERSATAGSPICRGWKSSSPLARRRRLPRPLAQVKLRQQAAAWPNWSNAECGVMFDPDALFDVQVKRIHEYKRQLLNVLHVIHLYDRIKRGDTEDWAPTVAC